MEFLQSLQAWHWLVLGLCLLLLELIGIGGFVLGMGLAALALALLTALMPAIDWHWQCVLFALLSVVLSWAYWKRFRRFNEATVQPLLNHRVQSLIGRKVQLLTPLINGAGKVQIEDALWAVSGSQQLPAGSWVEVVGASGMVLQVVSVAASEPSGSL